jgi:hypothetical protein
MSKSLDWFLRRENKSHFYYFHFVFCPLLFGGIECHIWMKNNDCELKENVIVKKKKFWTHPCKIKKWKKLVLTRSRNYLNKNFSDEGKKKSSFWIQTFLINNFSSAENSEHVSKSENGKNCCMKNVAVHNFWNAYFTQVILSEEDIAYKQSHKDVVTVVDTSK